MTSYPVWCFFKHLQSIFRKKGRKVITRNKQFKDDRRTTIMVGWAGLPDDLVDAISRRLPLLSVVSMSHVCKSWRRVLVENPPPTQKLRGLPWLMLSGRNDSEVRTCLSILDKRVHELHVPEALGKFCWGSIQDWLIVVNNRVYLLEIFFWNPFSRAKLLLPDALDLYSKMLLSASPTDPSCVTLLLGDTGQRVSCWIPGAKTWRTKHLGQGTFADAVFCAGTFYFVTHGYNIFTITAETLISAMKQGEDCNPLEFKLHCHQVAMPDRPTCPRVRPYLVESCGEVLLVCRLFDQLQRDSTRVTHSFEVFMLDAARMIWTKMESLGDRVLFLGKSDSRSFPAEDLGDDIANSIYFFAHDQFTLYCNEWTTVNKSSHKPFSLDDWGAFSLDRNCFIPNSCNRGNNESWPPIWITAPIWWYFSDNNPQIHDDASRIVSV